MKVLVCDRDPAAVTLVRRSLERLGHDVVAAYGEAEALRQLRAQWPDFVVLDAPTIGLGLVRTMREEPWFEPIPCVVLTARPDDAAVVEGYRAGADMVLIKPFDPQELIPFAPRD